VTFDRPCQQLQAPQGKDGKAMLRWSQQAIADYNRCADRVDGLRQAWPK
jgi:hypothetical protein